MAEAVLALLVVGLLVVALWALLMAQWSRPKRPARRRRKS